MLDRTAALPLHAFRFQYEEEVQRNPLNYDNWFDYVKLEESTGDVERVREVSGERGRAGEGEESTGDVERVREVSGEEGRSRRGRERGEALGFAPGTQRGHGK